MDKAKNLIVLLLEVGLVLAVVIFATVYIWTSSTEKTYNQVLSDIAAGNYTQAASQIKTIPHYKDSNDISIYIYPISLFYKKYDSTELEASGYRMAQKAISEVLPRLKNQSYKKDLSELNSVLEFKLEKSVIQQENLKQDQVISEIEAGLKLGDIAGATEKINKLDKPSLVSLKEELLAFIALLNAENLGDDKAAKEAISKLDPKYSGKMSVMIQQEVLKYVDSIEWNELYGKKAETIITRPLVSLGMNRVQVHALLGTPTKGSKIKNRYGSFETQIFESFGTLYFDNEKLVAYREKQ